MGEAFLLKLTGKQTPGELWLYNLGNEYVSVTGGWVPETLNNAQAIKASDHLQVIASGNGPSNPNGSDAIFVTANPIDLSKYSVLEIEAEGIYVSTWGAGDIRIFDVDRQQELGRFHVMSPGRATYFLDISFINVPAIIVVQSGVGGYNPTNFSHSIKVYKLVLRRFGS